MSCPHCQGLETLFDDTNAKKELKTYRQKGPNKTTRLLLEALKDHAILGLTLLDIGGGVGAIQHELLQAGISHATGVDASSAYLEAARREAERQGLADDRVTYHFGDFVELAPNLPPADIITLDRAICCYPDMPALVGRSAEKAQRFYGVVYPRDVWWMKLGVWLINTAVWLRRSPYRFFVHPRQTVEQVIEDKGLQVSSYRKTFLWQVVLYERLAPYKAKQL